MSDLSESAAEWVSIGDLKPWDQNPRQNDHIVGDIARSIERFGFASPIIARRNGEVIAGHTRLKAAQSLGLDRVPVRFMDLDPVDAKMLSLADNKLGELAEWNNDSLADILQALEAEGVDIADLGWNAEEISTLFNTSDAEPYSTKIQSPIYEVTGDKPTEAELTDHTRTNKLLEDISNADIPEPVREMLMAAAGRHTVFHYDKMAEYYAHAPPRIQQLMEDSALVIIDFDKAIELGFVKLTKRIAAAYRSDHG